MADAPRGGMTWASIVEHERTERTRSLIYFAGLALVSALVIAALIIYL